MKIRSVFSASGVVFACLFLQGCGVFKADLHNRPVWYDGALRSVEEADFEEIQEAAGDALDAMVLPIRKQRVEAGTGRMEAGRTREKPVVISFKYLTTTTSELRIDAGRGRERLARRIHENVRRFLQDRRESRE